MESVVVVDSLDVLDVLTVAEFVLDSKVSLSLPRDRLRSVDATAETTGKSWERPMMRSSIAASLDANAAL